jgi:sorbitol/mannitol transport system substrate-binding protein
MVPNSQMTDARELSSRFDAENPDTKLRSITFGEPGLGNDHRTHRESGGEFDVVMIATT